MPFRLFHDLFPEIAERETRSVILPTLQGDLPVGSYTFMEMFCDERGCDCRRAFFWVEASYRKGPEAVVTWGWEDAAFYEKWLRYGNKNDARDLQGPILNTGSPETELAPHILDLFRKVLLSDIDYIERIKRHYRMFREVIETGANKTNPHRPRKRGRGLSR